MAGNMDRKTLFVGLITLLILAAVIGSTSGPPAPSTKAPPLYRPELDYVRNGDLAVQRIDRLAAETKGDFTKLSTEDQEWMDRMTLGNGAVMFRKRAETLRRETEAKQRSKASGKPDTATSRR